MNYEIVEHALKMDEHGIAGYLAYPRRAQPGPALLLVHQYTGLTGYLKIEARKYAKLGYTTIIPNLYELLGHPSVTHIHLGAELQRQTSDAQFVAAITRGWDYLLALPGVAPERAAVAGYCMGGRIALHFVAATPNVRAFVGYYPTVRDEPQTEMRPRRGWEAAADFKCPSLIMFGADETVSPIEVQLMLFKACLENGRTIEWHYFDKGGHGFIDPDAFYEPHTGELAWPLVVDFLQRELGNYYT
jgi:carboxymethylenebutenolidase